MSKIQENLAQRARVINEQRALLDAVDETGGGLTAEQRATLDRLDESITALDQARAVLEAAEQRATEQTDLEQRFGRLVTNDDPDPGMQRAGITEEAVRQFLRGERRSLTVTPDQRYTYPQLRAIAAQTRDLTKSPATAGGHTVGSSFYAQLIDHLIEVSGVMQAGPTVLITDRGDNLPIPRTTAHSTAASEIGEGVAITESDPAFAQLVLGAYKYGVLVQVGRELEEDTYVDLLGYLAMQAGRAVGNAFGARLVTGSGVSQPQGVATAATVGVTGGAGVAGAFTADNLIDLHYSVIAPYRNSPSCGWLMRDASMGAVRKLKDSQGQYLWVPSIQAGTPDTLLGKPVFTDPNVAAVGLAARSVLFGDMSRYVVRQVKDVRFERSDEFAFNSDLITFRCVVRGDGGLADTTGAIKAFVGNAA